MGWARILNIIFKEKAWWWHDITAASRDGNARPLHLLFENGYG
jgi:hypothetical protein